MPKRKEEEIPEPPKPPEKPKIKEFEAMSVPSEYETRLVKHEKDPKEDRIISEEEFRAIVLNKLAAIEKGVV